MGNFSQKKSKNSFPYQHFNFFFNISIWKGTITEKQIYHYYPLYIYSLGKKGKLVIFMKGLNTWQCGLFNLLLFLRLQFCAQFILSPFPRIWFLLFCFLLMDFSSVPMWGWMGLQRVRLTGATFDHLLQCHRDKIICCPFTPMIKASPPTRNTQAFFVCFKYQTKYCLLLFSGRFCTELVRFLPLMFEKFTNEDKHLFIIYFKKFG